MLNKVIRKMTVDIKTMVQTYKWRNDKNTLPFNWKCQTCGTKTDVLSADTTKHYECSNPDCPTKLKFVLIAF